MDQSERGMNGSPSQTSEFYGKGSFKYLSLSSHNIKWRHALKHVHDP